MVCIERDEGCHRRDRDMKPYLSIIPQAVCIGQSSVKASEPALLRAACSLVKRRASSTMPFFRVVIMFVFLEINGSGDDTRGGSHD